MKKIVSLFLACLMVLSIGMIPAFATTETELYPNKEESLAEGNLTAKPASGGFGTTNFTLTEVMKEEVKSNVGAQAKKDGDNVYFELDGYNTRYDRYHSHKLFIYDYNAASNSTKIKKYSALISLPTTEQGTVNVFAQQDWAEGNDNAFNVKGVQSFGVMLNHGGASYWDAATNEYINFIPAGTMKANKYYRVEAIMDARARTVSTTPAPLYMRAFVYDGETLLGETGWVWPCNYAYQYYLTGRVTIIDAYGFPEDNCTIKVDEFKGYKIENLPAYEITDGALIAVNNKYVSASSGHTWYRTAGEVFNPKTTASANNISASSVNKVARYEMSFRVPGKFASSHNFIGFVGGTSMANSNRETKGMAKITNTGAFSAVDVNGTNVALTGANVADNTLQLAVDTWYNLAIEVDYTTYATPSAKTVLKDSEGNTLAESAAYTVAQMVASNYAQTSIMWVYMPTTNTPIHFDNTKVYVAPDKDTLATAAPLISEDFEVYEGANAARYADGALYMNITPLHGVYTSKGVTNQGKSDSSTVVIASEVLVLGSGLEFTEGMTFPKTQATKLRFSYNNDVPNANINYNNIKLVSGDVEFVGGVDYVVAAGNDGAVAGTSKTFTVSMPKFLGKTDYAIRLLAGLSDYNTHVALDNALMGVPADNGLYKDIPFNTKDDAKETSVASNLVDASGAAAASLTVGEVVEGKVIVANGGADAIAGYVILGIYDGNELVTALISETAFSAAAGATISASTPEYTVAKDGLKAKVFVWKDLTNLQPIIAAEVVPAE